MADITIHTRPSIDIPLALIAIGLVLLLAFTMRDAQGAQPSNATPIVSPAPTELATAPANTPAPPKEKPKAHG